MKTLPILFLILTVVACASAENECRWLGTAPFCTAHRADCIGKFNQYWYSRKQNCWTGSKALCCTEPPPAREEENLNMATLMGEPRQPEEMEGFDPGLVLAYAHYDKIIPEN